MEKHWLAIYTKPRNEKKVEEKLTNAGYEVYLPLQTMLKQWSDRKKKVQVPLIPSYVFVKVSDQERLSVLQHPGILNFVFWLNKPAVVREDDIQRLKFYLKEDDCEIVVDSLSAGERAQINSGQFKNEQVLILSSDKKEYTVILESLGYKLRISKLNISK